MSIEESCSFDFGGDLNAPDRAEKIEKFRALMHRAVDDCVDFLDKEVHEKPAWRQTPAPLCEMTEKVPVEGQDLESVYEEYKRDVLPYAYPSAIPRMFGWAVGGGTAECVLAEMLKATSNPLASGGDCSSAYIDIMVVRWVAELIEFRDVDGKPADGSLTSGSTAATYQALFVARQLAAERLAKERGLLDGLAGSDATALVAAAGVSWAVLCSAGSHGSAARAVDLLGIGRDNLIKVDPPTAAEYAAALDRAVAAGKTPLAFFATVGSINLGQVDDMAGLVELARLRGVWVHVDAALGAGPLTLPEFRAKHPAVMQADSIALDLHKTLSVAYDCGCVLFRDPAFKGAMLAQFSYLAPHKRGISLGPGIAPFSLEFSRPFRGLKVWFWLKHHGVEGIRRVVRHKLAVTEHARGLLAARSDQFELAPAGEMNVICFRYKWPGATTDQLTDGNREILMNVHEAGQVVPSFAMLDGAYWLRCAICNHRTTKKDVQTLIDECAREGENYVKNLK